MSALSAIEAGTVDEISAPGSETAAAGLAQLRRHDLHLVTGSPRPGRVLPGAGDYELTAWPDARPQVRVSSARSAGAAKPALAVRSAHKAQPAVRLRLTRRGRIVAAALAIVLATMVITVLGIAVSGGARATSHGRAGAGYQGMRQIVVRPGQTLWSIAAQAEPSADARLVIDQIMTANSMTNPVIQSGELLWVPR